MNKKPPNYYDCFIDSLLKLPPKVRNAVLRAASTVSSDGNPYLYLWNCYSDMDNATGNYIKELFDEYNLALD